MCVTKTYPRYEASAETQSMVLFSQEANDQRWTKQLQSSYKAADLQVVKRPPVRGVEYTGKLRLREQPKMGSKNSRTREQRKEEAEEAPSSIPPDSPLGRMLQAWGNNPEPGIKKNKK